jgi:hypothetical protein
MSALASAWKKKGLKSSYFSGKEVMLSERVVLGTRLALIRGFGDGGALL